MAAHLGISKQTALDTVEQRISASGGTIDYGDLMQQVHRAYEYLDNKTDGEAVLQAEKPSSFSPDLLKMISGSKRIDDPVNFIGQRSMRSPKLVTSEDFLNCLYEPGENVVVFTTQQSQGQVVFKVGELDCQPLPKQGLEGVWYLIQPVDGLWHETQTPGRLSRRSKEAVVHWRYLLLESDEAEIDQWLRLVIQLPLRISAIYTSGGRSIHVLVRVDASSKEEWDGFKVRIARILVPLGADPRALTAVRLSRLPQCMRGERLQELLYLNPAAVATPILELPPHAPENFKEDHHERSD